MNQPRSQIISAATLLPIGFVISMLGVAFAIGGLYQRVDDMSSRLARIENKLDQERVVATQSREPIAVTP